MGIQGLIPFLEKASQPVNVSQFSGCTVAVDAYCWLHKGAFACAEKLARGDHTDQYVVYCMKYVNMLLHHNIKPILVFDGSHLKAKADTEKKRRESRELNRRKAAELLRLDRANEAKTFLRRCVDVTHEMALNLIKECRSRNVDCIVAPFEADAQLGYFSVNDIADIVITEDSDLLLFGCKKVLFKMDTNGNGLLVDQKKLHLAMGIREDAFSLEKFRHMCILSGCDYLPSLPGIGLAKACRFITRSIEPDIHKALTRLPMHLNMSQLCVSSKYRDQFLEADSVFKYQPVFNPFTRKVVPLTSPPEGESPPDLWNVLPEDQAQQLALGNLDPFNLKKMDDWNPDSTERQLKRSNNWNGRAPHKSIWSPDFFEVTKKTKEEIERKKKNSGAFLIERPSTLGKQVIQKAQTPTKKRPIEDVEDEKVQFKQMYGSCEQPAKKLCFDQNDVKQEIKEEEESPTEKPKRPIRIPFSKSESQHSTPLEETKWSKSTSKLRKTVLDDSQYVVSGYFFDSSEPETKQDTNEVRSSSNCQGESVRPGQKKTIDSANTDILNSYVRKPLIDIKNASPPVSPEKCNRSNASPPTSPELIISKNTKKRVLFSKKVSTQKDENESLLDSFDKKVSTEKDESESFFDKKEIKSNSDSLRKKIADFDDENDLLTLPVVVAKKSPNSIREQSCRDSSGGTTGNFNWTGKLDNFRRSSVKKSLASSQEFKSPVQCSSANSLFDNQQGEKNDNISSAQDRSAAGISVKSPCKEITISKSPIKENGATSHISSQELDEGFCSPSLDIVSNKEMATPKQVMPSSAKKTLSQPSCRPVGLSKKSPAVNLKQNKLSRYFFKEKPKIS